MQRLRHALRSLAKARLLSLVVVLSLGLGIGANTAIFSVLNQILLSSVPVQHPEQLALVSTPGAPKNGSMSTDDSGGTDFVFSYRAFREFERKPQGVKGVVAFNSIGTNLTYERNTISGRVMLVSGGYFGLLGVRPVVGRPVTPEDDRGTGNPVVVVSYRYWRDHLGEKAEALNQPMRINGQPFTIVGVAPKGFNGTTFGSQPDAFVPLAAKQTLVPGWDGLNRYNDYFLYLIARVGPGDSLQKAGAGLNALYAALVDDQLKSGPPRDADYAKRLRQSKLVLTDGRRGSVGARDEGKVPLIVLMSATGMVLLIAMANAANLLLARSAERRKELAIRAALGAGRGEILGQLLTEAMLLAGGGGLAGIALSWATLRTILARLSADGPPVEFLTAQIQWPTLLYAIGLSLLTGLLFGLYPAWEASRAAPGAAMNLESGRASAAAGPARVRRVLVCAQVLISAVLLIPTGLFLKSLVNLTHVDLGIRAENLVACSISPELNGYKAEQSRELFERAQEALSAIPGVTGVSSGMVPLLSGSNWMSTLTVEGYRRGPNSDTNSSLNEIGPNFFGVLGAPLLVGRDFTERDNLAGQKVAIVNEQFARYFFGNASPLGRKFVPGLGTVIPNIEIVGVVKDSQYSGVKQKIPRVYYTPWRQDEKIGFLTFYLRTAVPPEQVIAQARRAIASLDSTLPARLRTMEAQIAQNIQSDTLVLQMAGVFAGLATLLAMLGLYGVMAHSVTRRTREIGIRMALGAAPGKIRVMVMRELLLILGIGLALGIPGALFLSRLAESVLFGVKSGDPLVVAAAALSLCAAALAAGWLPARRAARVDPLVALHYE